ncbi:hypothetical protein ACFXA3_38060, partial [Streptomyces sp. NPDC059456]
RHPRVVYAVRGSLFLQGAMFGACQAGIAALTARLGVPGQAGIVYAAMGVVSAAVGLALGALPARFGLRLRWRAATGAALVLSVPLLFTDGLWPLYAVVTVLGAAYAPHLITSFALTERAVEPVRLAESTAFAASSLVAGQAAALAASGRLAEWYGPAGAFAVAVGAAASALILALTTRVPAARAHPAAPRVFIPAQQSASPDLTAGPSGPARPSGRHAPSGAPAAPEASDAPDAPDAPGTPDAPGASGPSYAGR